MFRIWHIASLCANIILAICTPFVATGQHDECRRCGALEGKLVSMQGEPIGFATVRLLGTKLSARTDAHGHFGIRTIPEGEYTLEAQRLGFLPLRQRVVIAAGQVYMHTWVMKERHHATEQLVVTGTLRETLISESPVLVESYTSNFLKKNPSVCLLDAMQAVNGVRSQVNCNVCGTGDIRIHGLPGAYSMVTIDGMPIVSGLATVYGLQGIPSAMIERIEIVKGPSSVLYGSEAIAGVINVITKTPERSARYAWDVFSTSWLEHSIDASAKIPIYSAEVAQERVRPIATGIVNVNYFHFDNRVDKNHDGLMDMPLQQRISAFTKWSFAREDKGEASCALRYIAEDRLGGELRWTPEFRGSDSVYGESIATNRLEVLGAYQLPIPHEHVVLRGSFNYHHQNSYYGTMFYQATQYIGFAQITWDKQFWKNHHILVGAATRYTWYQDNTPVTRDMQGQLQPQQILLPGIFVQDEIALHRDHTLLLSARYDYSTVHGSIITPRVNYKWQVSGSDVVRLSGGKGFRVVNLFAEEHAALTGARQIVVEEQLRPEESWNFLLQYSMTLETELYKASIDATAFYTHFSNKIVPDYDTDPEKILYKNLRGYAVSQGISVNASLDILPLPLTARIGCTVMDVFDVQDGKRTWQILTERWSGVFSLSYTIREWGVTLDYTGSVVGPMRLPVFPHDPRPPYSPVYSLQNIQVTKKFEDETEGIFAGQPLELYGGIKNLLNYTPPANAIMRAFDPFDKYVHDPINNPHGFTFDPTYAYAPFQGIRAFVGMRWHLE
ncbi:MAG: TonB-dependent receptor [Bacteroidota bacterium]|nr:TonB-dependent receptor [Candidatus Kapabacteria bacterium]MDW8219447.1 TonB-dependent receptor [Bacteroidota bacterium]